MPPGADFKPVLLTQQLTFDAQVDGAADPTAEVDGGSSACATAGTATSAASSTTCMVRLEALSRRLTASP